MYFWFWLFGLSGIVIAIRPRSSSEKIARGWFPLFISKHLRDSFCAFRNLAEINNSLFNRSCLLFTLGSHLGHDLGGHLGTPPKLSLLNFFYSSDVLPRLNLPLYSLQKFILFCNKSSGLRPAKKNLKTQAKPAGGWCLLESRQAFQKGYPSAVTYHLLLPNMLRPMGTQDFQHKHPTWCVGS